MKKTFGERLMFKPDGMLREVHWPSLATMDTRTGDGRMLMSSGAGVRNLPRTFNFQFAEGMGHEGAVPVGRIDQVTFDDDGNIEGYGWLLDSEQGRQAAVLIATQTQRHNSIELADAKADIDIDWDSMEIRIDFTEWNLAATTGVARPAFADATVELPDEMMAAIFDTEAPLVVAAEGTFDIRVDMKIPEITASAATTVPWADFHIPESPEPHKIVVDADGRVYGNLAVWGEPHRGFVDQLRTAPRPTDGYTGFNHSGPLTERGAVGTGPIFAVGGHAKKSVRGMDRQQIADAYGGIENTWADVRVTEGVHGPWVSGRLRPGLSDETIYACRASHISGHWLGDELVAIVSCNVPGFKPGAGFAAFDDGAIVELVASFPAPPDEMLNGELVSVDVDINELAEAIAQALGKVFNHSEPRVPVDASVDASSRQRLAIELELDDG